MRRESRIKKHKPDKPLFIVIFILLILGLIIMASASIVVSNERFNSPYKYFFHQLLYGVGIGLVGFFIAQKVYYKSWKKVAILILALVICGLVSVFVPGLGFGSGGAKRWIDLKVFSFQPTELVKLGFIIYLSAWLSKKKGEIKSFSKSTLPFLIFLALLAFFLIAQPDISTLGVIAITGVIMYFLAGAKITHVLSIILAGAGTLLALIKIAPYRMNRFLTFLNPDIDPLGIGYQIKQSLLTVGSGGIFGVGWGLSRQKYNYLPSPISDSIFAIIAEELGFIVAAGTIILFLFLAIRGLKIAKNSSDRFGFLLASGITSWFIIQALVNIGAIIGLVPLTGITLPFISYGSSSMIACLFGAGILINISKYTEL